MKYVGFVFFGFGLLLAIKLSICQFLYSLDGLTSAQVFVKVLPETVCMVAAMVVGYLILAREKD